MKNTLWGVGILFFLVLPSDAHAYLDPGTGSYLLQVLLAALVAITFGFRAFWSRIKGFFSGISGKQIDPNNDESPE